jgi:hypothetical protein
MQRRCGCDCLAVQLTWFGTSLNSTAAIGPKPVTGPSKLSALKPSFAA